MPFLKNSRWILENLHHLIANNVIGDKQYDNRYKGFRGELSYLERYRSRMARLYTGCYLLPTMAGAETTCDPVYFTITADKLDVAYERIYDRINRLNCVNLYFIQYEGESDPSNWKLEDVMGIGVPLPVPKFTTKIYDTTLISLRLARLNHFLRIINPLGDPIKLDIRSRLAWPRATWHI